MYIGIIGTILSIPICLARANKYKGSKKRYYLYKTFHGYWYIVLLMIFLKLFNINTASDPSLSLIENLINLLKILFIPTILCWEDTFKFKIDKYIYGNHISIESKDEEINQ